MYTFKKDTSQNHSANWQIHKPVRTFRPGYTGTKPQHQLYTRKLVAIMFTDIVGYTSMIEKDEAYALRVLSKNREIQKPIIRQFNGTWIKEMGDGILSSFNSATGAINCALRIQQMARNLGDFRLHIGIHLDKVIFMEYDVYGIGVNIAFRIQELAHPEKTWVSGGVYNHCISHQNLGFQHIGQHHLKNVKQPVEIYEVAQTNCREKSV